MVYVRMDGFDFIVLDYSPFSPGRPLLEYAEEECALVALFNDGSGAIVRLTAIELFCATVKVPERLVAVMLGKAEVERNKHGVL